MIQIRYAKSSHVEGDMIVKILIQTILSHMERDRVFLEQIWTPILIEGLTTMLSILKLVALTLKLCNKLGSMEWY